VKPKSDDDDIHLFREAVRDVKPLGQHRTVTKSPKATLKRRISRRPGRVMIDDPKPGSATADPVVTAGDEVSFRKPGVQAAVIRKLRRGEYGIQAQIDLHGLTADQGLRALEDFLSHAMARGIRTLRVIHGKGLRSGGEAPVLKNAVISALRRTSVVKAFVSARREDGGTGAVYVLLKSPK
jgi:DNA-nicking Smr family endonuclease